MNKFLEIIKGKKKSRNELGECVCTRNSMEKEVDFNPEFIPAGGISLDGSMGEAEGGNWSP